MQFYRYLRHRFLFILLCFVNSGCKKFLDVGSPITDITSFSAFAEDKTATAVMTSTYFTMMGPNFQGPNGINSFSVVCGLASDEFTYISNSPNKTLQLFYQNNLNSTIGSYWSALYKTIATCNRMVEGLTISTSLSPSVNKQLLAEAKFLRAFSFFYLANLYGDVPLVLTTDYKIISSMERTPVIQVYEQIIRDLKEAQQGLSEDFLDGNLQKYSGAAERIRPTKWAATALLARVYLYNRDWVNAETEASKLIASSLFNLSLLNNAFLKSSLGNMEAIWQLQPIDVGYNTKDGYTFIIPSTGPTNDQPVKISEELLNSFENGDLRRNANWIDSITVGGSSYYYPFKYKVNRSPSVTVATGATPMTEFLNVFRLSEQYLIRAEARAQQNNVDGSQDDLNIIRNRAGLPNAAASDKDSLLSSILRERQVEFFAEWGHRWFDLKRIGKLDIVMPAISTAKGGSWESTDKFFPIPVSEIDLNHHLIQNEGY
ncbi:MAG: RagB/SusD family nutrient uptake outer membrane protein [Agriterribacter sp.]